MNGLEDWFLNVFAGKLVARAAVLIAGYVAGPIVQTIAAKVGVSVAVDPAKLQVELMVLFNAAFEWFKKRRMANPNSPAVQTDAKLLPSSPVALPASNGNPQVPPAP